MMDQELSLDPRVLMKRAQTWLVDQIDRFASVERSWPSGRKRKLRMLVLACAILSPVLCLLFAVPDDKLDRIGETFWIIAALSITGLFLLLIHQFRHAELIGTAHGLWLTVLIGYGPLLTGDATTPSLILLVFVPVVMGFTSGARASAIGTLAAVSMYYGVLVSGFAQRDYVPLIELSWLAHASMGTVLCGLLVHYFEKQTHRESTALNKDNVRIRALALTDPLTKRLNRRAFQMTMDRFVIQSGSGAHPALCILDLDGFKQINDTHGHDVGDQVLTVFAERLKSVVGRGREVYRLGGDEFAIVCDHESSLEALEAFGKQLAALTREPIKTQFTEVEMDVSIGIALSDGTSVSIQSLYQQADMAAFVAKENTGSNYVIFDTMLDGQVNRKFDVERALKAAIEYGYINVAFQPQIDLKTGRTTGFEALARWRDPVLGAVSPGEFVGIAEESSLIQVLDREIISKALMSAGTWLASDQRVSINASARSLNTHEFANFVLQEVKRSGLNYEQVEVEITESALIENWDKAKRTVSLLRRAGMRIVLDDFGVGYSSLSYLVEFPVQKIKFDRSFLLKASDASSAMVMESIANLANKMGVDLVAEGIETTDQLELVRRIKCHTGQGYLFSRPILAEKMADYVQSQRKAA